MSILQKRHVLGAGGTALVGGVAAGALGFLLGGPAAMVAGVVVGTTAGALLGHRFAESVDPRGNLGHFQQLYLNMPYYVDGMTWDDYAPAYRFGLDTYRTRGAEPFDLAAPALGTQWHIRRAGSRLDWDQAGEAVRHVWHEMDESLHNRGRA